jgi:hypothetical protein
MRNKDDELNQAAYRRLEASINATYPHGQFVAIAGGEIVGDAAEFMALHQALREAGRDPRRVMIVQAGQVYPEKLTILALEALTS